MVVRKLVLPRKEGWYCQGRKLAKEAGVLPKMEAQGQGSADWAGRVFAFLSAGADTKANTRWLVRGCGALELGDLRLFEDGGERGGALVSDVVVLETVVL